MGFYSISDELEIVNEFKIIVKGTKAQLFVKAGKQPSLIVKNIKRSADDLRGTSGVSQRRPT